MITKSFLSVENVSDKHTWLDTLLSFVLKDEYKIPEDFISYIYSILDSKEKHSNIYKVMAHYISQKTDVLHPHWKNIAGNFILLDYYNQVLHNRNIETPYENYFDYLEKITKEKLYEHSILDNYSKEELLLASSFLHPEWDFDFDFAGIQMLIHRYLIWNHKDAFELPQEMFLSIALFLSAYEKKENRMEMVKEVYEYLAQRKISLATPFLANLRRPNGNLSSCFILAMDDNIEDIFYIISQIALISKSGGGIGVNMSRIRSAGAPIQGYMGLSNGAIPWIRIINDTAVAVNQLGKRSGAVTIALDVWHRDIIDFLELQTENGDQRKKAYDVFPQVVVCDLFCERLEKNENWTLFDPHEIEKKYHINLANLWGDEFNKFYLELEKDENLMLKKSIPAKEIIVHLLKTQIETGMPYVFFKDTVNRMNPNQHDGMIGNGNLCQESFSNFNVSKMKDSSLNEEKLDYHMDAGKSHTCNLVSLNLAKLLTIEEIEKASVVATKILDHGIDLTKTPIPESNLHNKVYRTIGIGAMGLADHLAYHNLHYTNNEETLKYVDNLFEHIAFNAILASSNLAKEKGSYAKFKGSQWDKGIIFNKNRQELVKSSSLGEKWNQVFDSLEKYGIRNSQLLSIAPNTSTALIQGCTPSILPIFSKFYIDKNSKGAVPVCPPFIHTHEEFYKENKDIDQHEVIEVVSHIQKWIDQGISMELVYNMNNHITAKNLYNNILFAWKSGCKAIYYTRTIQKNAEQITL